MAVTWEEALAEREAIGEVKGLAAGEAKGLAAGEAKGLAAGEAKGLAAGEARGKLIATRQAIVLLARHCFRSLPAGLEEKLEAIDDLGRLYEILERVHEARTVEDLSI
jgi:flagellar biosynthesis/type III secretory pathway protein FliH